MKKHPGPTSKRIVLTAEEKQQLEFLGRRPRGRRGCVSFRSKIILLSAQGLSNGEVCRKVGTTYRTVALWRKRFFSSGIDGLYDEPKPGAPRKISDNKIDEVVVKTLEELPVGATHWSTRMMARKVGLSQSAVSRIWRAFGLKPHRSSTYILSKDPLFVEKVRDVVGLYMSPPENALVLSVDEKSQIQALDRVQPILPLRPGTEERKTPEYNRHGTTTLFAALNIKTGHVIGRCYSRHRAIEFRKFLECVDSQTPFEQEVHLILDNYRTHKTPLIHRWLVRHPRFHLHFIPTYSSWLNLVERWFALLTERQIKRGAHTSVPQLKAAIEGFISHSNSNPKPFVWTKTADIILEKVARYAAGTLQAHTEVTVK
jgi:transposase